MTTSALRLCWDALDALKRCNSLTNAKALVSATERRPDFDTFLTESEISLLRQAFKLVDREG
jgi:hypothetical protein